MANAYRPKDDDSFDNLTQAQLETYAKELRELYAEERRLRRDLQQEKQGLELRLRELRALNRLFQQHLEQRFKAEQTYRELAVEVRSLLRGVESLLQHIEEQLPPEGEGLPAPLASLAEPPENPANWPEERGSP